MMMELSNWSKYIKSKPGTSPLRCIEAKHKTFKNTNLENLTVVKLKTLSIGHHKCLKVLKINDYQKFIEKFDNLYDEAR